MKLPWYDYIPIVGMVTELVKAKVNDCSDVYIPNPNRYRFVRPRHKDGMLKRDAEGNLLPFIDQHKTGHYDYRLDE